LTNYTTALQSMFKRQFINLICRYCKIFVTEQTVTIYYTSQPCVSLVKMFDKADKTM
jgi:hypothetical protein